jgi:hypothetical protein
LSGIESWVTPHLRGVYLGGVKLYVLEGGFSQARPQAGGVVRMHGGPDVVQYEFTGATGPLYVQRLEWSGLSFDVSSEEAYRAVDRATRAAQTTWFPELAIEDEWSATGGQTLFSLSRVAAYGAVTGVTLASHPPSATLNGTALTRVTGTPGAGEFKVSATAGAQWGAITTPALTAGDVLRVIYHPLFAVTGEMGVEYPVFNGLAADASMREIRVGRFD